MGNSSSNKNLVKDIFRMLDEDGSQTLNWKEVQRLTLCTPVARRLNSLKLEKKINLQWTRDDLAKHFANQFRITEEELVFIHTVLKLKCLPNDIFQILDQQGDGFVYAEQFRSYLNSLKDEKKWVADKVDQTLAAMYSCADEGGRMIPPNFARCLIMGGFDKNQMEALYQHVKASHGTVGMDPPQMPEEGLIREDIVKEFTCDIRDMAGQWCSGTVIQTKKNRAKVHYLDYPATYDEWIDLKTELHRFAQIGKYSSMDYKQVGSYREGNKVLVYTPYPLPKRWRYGKIKKFLYNQMSIYYNVAGQRYNFYVHAASPEVKPARADPQGESMQKTKDGKWFVGQIVEVLDTVGRWEPAEVLRIKPRNLFVHYVQWGSKWDEWLNIDINKTRLRALGAAIMQTAEERMNKEEQEKFYAALRSKYGYEVAEIQGDGNCLFRSFAHQIYGDQEKHMEVRKMCYDYLEKEKDCFSVFIADDFSHYCKEMRQKNKWGGHVEIAVLRELFNVNVEIFDRGEVLEPRPIGGAAHSDSMPVVRLAYEGHKHYNSIVDPKSMPPYGDGKDRKVNLRTIRKSKEQKDTKTRGIAKPPEMLRKFSADKLLAPRDDPASDLNDNDYNQISQAYMDQTTFSVPLEKIRDMICAIIMNLFKKKASKYVEQKEELEKLKDDTLTSSELSDFLEGLVRGQEINDNQIFVANIITQFREKFQPPLMWRIRSLITGSRDTKPKEMEVETTKIQVVDKKNQRPEAKIVTDVEIVNADDDLGKGSVEQKKEDKKSKEQAKEEPTENLVEKKMEGEKKETSV